MVPAAPSNGSLVKPPSTPAEETTAAKPIDPQLLELLKSPPTRKPSTDDSLRELEVRAKLGIIPKPEHTGERQFPWPIDILLYPTNSAGLTALTILVAIPVLLHVVERLLHMSIPVLMPVRFLIGFYGAWYFAECVQDSAEGGTRAPDPFGTIVGMDEMRVRIANLVAVYLVFTAPVGFYYLLAQRMDAIFWVLVAWAVVFFPIVLLAVIIEESLSALNPLFLLGSIFRVLRPYIGLLLLIMVPAALAWFLAQGHEDTEREPTIWLEALGQFLAGYATFLMAHILGRFYWRHADRLEWDF